MALIEKTAEPDEYLFWCPGCKIFHWFNTGDGVPSWTFDHNLTEPTVTPSILVNQSRPERRCHLFITKGSLIYLQDCHHDLAGTTVPMVSK